VLLAGHGRGDVPATRQCRGCERRAPGRRSPRHPRGGRVPADAARSPGTGLARGRPTRRSRRPPARAAPRRGRRPTRPGPPYAGFSDSPVPSPEAGGDARGGSA
jgi:hypothetical protein